MVHFVSMVVPPSVSTPPFPAAGDRQPRDRRGDTAVDPEHRGRPPPLTVTPAFGPVIVSVPVVSSARAGEAVRVIVCGVLNTLLSKAIVSFPPAEFAWTIAQRRSWPSTGVSIGLLTVTSTAACGPRAPVTSAASAAVSGPRSFPAGPVLVPRFVVTHRIFRHPHGASPYLRTGPLDMATTRAARAERPADEGAAQGSFHPPLWFESFSRKPRRPQSHRDDANCDGISFEAFEDSLPSRSPPMKPRRMTRNRMVPVRSAGEDIRSRRRVISWAFEDVGISGSGFIARHGSGHELQDAAVAIDPASFAQRGAIRLVGGHRATVQVHGTIERVDPPTQGRPPFAWLARPCNWSATERCSR